MKPTLYPNGFPSAYEELKTFYPVFYRDVFEMDAIWRAAGGGLDEIEDGVDAVVNNNFVSLMDTDTLAQMETFLGIPLNQKRTLEARRKLVALYFIGGNHIGSQEIKDIVFGYTGASSSVEFKNSRIYVKLFPNDNSTFLSSDVMECLKRKIPAHLSLSLVLAYIPDLQPAYVAAAPCGMAAFWHRSAARKHQTPRRHGSWLCCRCYERSAGCRRPLNCPEPSTRKTSPRRHTPPAGLRTRTKP